MVGESNQNVFLIQIDASSSAEFKISEFDILRVDFIYNWAKVSFQGFKSRPYGMVRAELGQTREYLYSESM